MLALLHARFAGPFGNGAQYVFMEHVRNGAGYDCERTIDALAMSMWKRDGLLLHGFEVKCSRSDWLTELRTPAKAGAWVGLVDRFWLVVADDSIVRVGELPEAWGLIVLRAGELVVVVEPRPLRPEHAKKPAKVPLPPALGRSALAAMMRAACRSEATSVEEEVVAGEPG